MLQDQVMSAVKTRNQTGQDLSEGSERYENPAAIPVQ
jgi:hypothetical protein